MPSRKTLSHKLKHHKRKNTKRSSKKTKKSSSKARKSNKRKSLTQSAGVLRNGVSGLQPHVPVSVHGLPTISIVDISPEDPYYWRYLSIQKMIHNNKRYSITNVDSNIKYLPEHRPIVRIRMYYYIKYFVESSLLSSIVRDLPEFLFEETEKTTRVSPYIPPLEVVPSSMGRIYNISEPRFPSIFWPNNVADEEYRIYQHDDIKGNNSSNTP
jgi:hypothetical protein